MSEPTLKPCPFCGGEAEMEVITTSVMDAVRKSVGCNTEGCQGCWHWDGPHKFVTLAELLREE